MRDLNLKFHSVLARMYAPIKKASAASGALTRSSLSIRYDPATYGARVLAEIFYDKREIEDAYAGEGSICRHATGLLIGMIRDLEIYGGQETVVQSAWPSLDEKKLYLLVRANDRHERFNQVLRSCLRHKPGVIHSDTWSVGPSLSDGKLPACVEERVASHLGGLVGNRTPSPLSRIPSKLASQWARQTGWQECLDGPYQKKSLHQYLSAGYSANAQSVSRAIAANFIDESLHVDWDAMGFGSMALVFLRLDLRHQWPASCGDEDPVTAMLVEYAIELGEMCQNTVLEDAWVQTGHDAALLLRSNDDFRGWSRFKADHLEGRQELSAPESIKICRLAPGIHGSAGSEFARQVRSAISKGRNDVAA